MTAFSLCLHLSMNPFPGSFGQCSYEYRCAVSSSVVYIEILLSTYPNGTTRSNGRSNFSFFGKTWLCHYSWGNIDKCLLTPDVETEQTTKTMMLFKSTLVNQMICIGYLQRCRWEVASRCRDDSEAAKSWRTKRPNQLGCWFMKTRALELSARLHR